MRIINILIPFALLAITTTSALAETPKCTITKIKDKDVSIDIAVDAKIGPDVFCKTNAQREAKAYAKANPVCAKDDAREATFPLTVTFGTSNNLKTFELKTYCPKLADRK